MTQLQAIIIYTSIINAISIFISINLLIRRKKMNQYWFKRGISHAYKDLFNKLETSKGDAWKINKVRNFIKEIVNGN